MIKTLIFGNSGSGKTTLATQLKNKYNIPVLDLDTITWEPKQAGVRLNPQTSKDLLDQYITRHSQWVIEGCYGSLIEHAQTYCNEMLFLNPGIEQCLANNLNRPWEKHKYPSKAAQNENLAFLQEWVREYYHRDDEYSLAMHQRIFENFKGSKQLIET